MDFTFCWRHIVDDTWCGPEGLCWQTIKIKVSYPVDVGVRSHHVFGNTYDSWSPILLFCSLTSLWLTIHCCWVFQSVCWAGLKPVTFSTTVKCSNYLAMAPLFLILNIPTPKQLIFFHSCLKIWTSPFNCVWVCLKTAGWVANNVYLDSTFFGICLGCTLFVQACLSKLFE